MSDKIRCPLYNDEIEDNQCFDISVIAEDMCPRRFLDAIVANNRRFNDYLFKL